MTGLESLLASFIKRHTEAREMFKPEQIVTMLRQIEVGIANGKTTPQACKEAEITVQTFHRWRKEYGGLKMDQAKRMKELEKENGKLKRLVALLQTPHRFRTKRQLWAYSGFAIETHDSGEYRYVRGKLRRNRERITVRGLNDNHNHDLKNLFKGAALSASTRPGPLYDFYVALLEKGMRPTMARLTLARKIAAITLTIWKKGVSFDAKQLHRQAA